MVKSWGCAVCEVEIVAEVVTVSAEVFEMVGPRYRLPCGRVSVGSGRAGVEGTVFEISVRATDV